MFGDIVQAVEQYNIAKKVVIEMCRSLCMLFACVAICVSCSISCHAGAISTGDGGWEWQNPITGSSNFMSVFFLDKDTGWVGGSGTLLSTNTAGRYWLPTQPEFTTPSTDKSLHSVCFTSPTVGWGVTGERSSTFFTLLVNTQDGGKTWSYVWLGQTMCVSKVIFIDENHGWVAGYYNGEGAISRTTDGGKTWTPANVENCQPVADMCFVDSQTGWAVGAYDSNHNDFIIKTTDGGQTWTRLSPNTYDSLVSVHFIDHSTGWTVGHNSYTGYDIILRTTDGGLTWSSQNIWDYQSRFLTSAYFVGNTGWIIGSERGCTYKTMDGGLTWTRQSLATYMIPNSIFAIDSNTAWITSSQFIFYTEDGGANWKSIGNQNSVDIYDASLVDKSTLVAVGTAYADEDHNAIIKTTDGGINWTPQASLYTVRLKGVSFIDPNWGWALGYDGNTYKTVIYRTTNGGTTWTSTTFADLSNAGPLCFLDKVNGCMGTANGLLCWTSTGGNSWTTITSSGSTSIAKMQFTSSAEGYAIGSVWTANSTEGRKDTGTIWHTTDMGHTWQMNKIAGLNALTSIFFLNPSTGWLADYQGTVLKTTDGGVTWASQPVSIGESSRSISFSDANAGWAVCGSEGVTALTAVYKTTDGGVNWSLKDVGTKRALTCVKFADTDTGWIFGQSGTILHTSTAGMPGCIWAKLRPDGTPANFGHVYIIAKMPDYIYVEHPDHCAGIRVNTTDSSLCVGDLVYIHGILTTTNGKKAIDADSVEVLYHGYSQKPTSAISDVKKQQSTTQVHCSNVVVTAIFANCIYVEQENRLSGIRVNTSDLSFNVGDLVAVDGALNTVDGERIIEAESIDLICPAGT